MLLQQSVAGMHALPHALPEEQVKPQTFFVHVAVAPEGGVHSATVQQPEVGMHESPQRL
jgi:hypothetical protein